MRLGVSGGVTFGKKLYVVEIYWTLQYISSNGRQRLIFFLKLKIYKQHNSLLCTEWLTNMIVKVDLHYYHLCTLTSNSVPSFLHETLLHINWLLTHLHLRVLQLCLQPHTLNINSEGTGNSPVIIATYIPRHLFSNHNPMAKGGSLLLRKLFAKLMYINDFWISYVSFSYLFWIILSYEGGNLLTSHCNLE